MNSADWEITPALITIWESGDRALVGELLTMFLDNTLQSVGTLLGGAWRPDAPECRKILHGLRSGCAQFGARHLAQLAAAAEISLETGDAAGVLVTVTKIAELLPRTRAAIEDFLNSSA